MRRRTIYDATIGISMLIGFAFSLLDDSWWPVAAVGIVLVMLWLEDRSQEKQRQREQLKGQLIGHPQEEEQSIQELSEK